MGTRSVGRPRLASKKFSFAAQTPFSRPRAIQVSLCSTSSPPKKKQTRCTHTLSGITQVGTSPLGDQESTTHLHREIEWRRLLRRYQKLYMNLFHATVTLSSLEGIVVASAHRLPRHLGRLVPCLELNRLFAEGPQLRLVGAYIVLPRLRLALGNSAPHLHQP